MSEKKVLTKLSSGMTILTNQLRRFKPLSFVVDGTRIDGSDIVNSIEIAAEMLQSQK